MNVGDIVRVESSVGAIEGKVVKVINYNYYNSVVIDNGWNLVTVPDDMYEVEVLRVAVPPEPTDFCMVWTQGDHTYVRYGANSNTYPWIDTVTGATYTWEQIHERG